MEHNRLPCRGSTASIRSFAVTSTCELKGPIIDLDSLSVADVRLDDREQLIGSPSGNQEITARGTASPDAQAAFEQMAP